MACKLRTHEPFDRSEYTSMKMFNKSLKHSHQRDDVLFYMESRAFTFLVRVRVVDPISDGNAFLLECRLYNITEKLASISHMCAPHRASKY